jgi:hypothetical protein
MDFRDYQILQLQQKLPKLKIKGDKVLLGDIEVDYLKWTEIIDSKKIETELKPKKNTNKTKTQKKYKQNTSI